MYVQAIELETMDFEGLTVDDATEVDGAVEPWAAVRVEHPSCRVFRLLSGGRIRGRVVASGCGYGTDDGPAGAPSMFSMMD